MSTGLRKALSLMVLVSMAAGFGARPAFAQIQAPVSWQGGSSNWNNPSNWNPVGVPNDTSSTFYDVTIPGGNTVTFDANSTTIESLANSSILQDDGNSRFLSIGDINSPFGANGTLTNSGIITWGNGGCLTIGNGGAL